MVHIFKYPPKALKFARSYGIDLNSFLHVLLALSVFSNLLENTQLHILADSDEREVVQQVQVSVCFVTNAYLDFLLYKLFGLFT